MIDAKMTLELQKNGIQKTVHCMSNEKDARYLIVTLTNNGKVVDMSSYDVAAYYENGDSVIGLNTTNSGESVTFPLPTLKKAGEYIFELIVGDAEHTLFSPKFRVQVEESISVGDAEGEEPDTAYKLLIVGENNYLSRNDAYDRDQVDDLLDEKANVDDVYNRDHIDEINDKLNTKADKSEIPVIPTKVSAFINDKGYLTEHQDLSSYATKAELSSKADFGVMMAMLGGKQNTLTAGEGISIIGDKISSTATSSGTIELTGSYSTTLNATPQVLYNKYFSDAFTSYSFTFQKYPVLYIKCNSTYLRVDVLEPANPTADGSVSSYEIKRYTYLGDTNTPSSITTVAIYPQGGSGGGKEPFFATYNVTPYDDVKQAIIDGRPTYVVYNYMLYQYVGHNKKTAPYDVNASTTGYIFRFTSIDGTTSGGYTASYIRLSSTSSKPNNYSVVESDLITSDNVVEYSEDDDYEENDMLTAENIVFCIEDKIAKALAEIGIAEESEF